VVVFSAVVGPVSAAFASSGEPFAGGGGDAPRPGGDAHLSVEDSLRFNASENISVWYYSVRPLRAHVTPADLTPGLDDGVTVQRPKTTVSVPSLFLESDDLSTDLAKSELYVFESGEPITVSFDGSTVGKAGVIDGETVQTVAVHLKKGVERPESVDDVVRLVTASDDATARIVETTTGQMGANYFQFTPTDSGQYVFATVLVDDPSGPGLVAAGDGNLTAKSDVTVVGFDHFIVQEGSSSITAPATAVAGSNITVSVDASANLSASTVSHTVLLVDEGALADQEGTIYVDGATVTEITSSIEVVEGVVSVEGGTNLFGNELPASRESGDLNLLSLATDFITDSTLLDGSPTVTATGSATVYASVNGTIGGPVEDVTIETTRSFAPGEYTIVHVATNHGGTATVTAERTIELVSPDLFVNGTVIEADGDPAANDFVYTWSDDPSVGFVGSNLTDARGRFLLPLEPGVGQEVGYVQSSQLADLDVEDVPDSNYPRDGSPDIYTLGTVSGDVGVDVTELGTIRLPDAGVLNVYVVDESGDPVENALVAVVHRANGGETGVVKRTSANGAIRMGADGVQGIEVVGDIGIAVRPPNDGAFVQRTYRRDVTVTTGGRSVTIRLAEVSGGGGGGGDGDGDTDPTPTATATPTATSTPGTPTETPTSTATSEPSTPPTTAPTDGTETSGPTDTASPTVTTTTSSPIPGFGPLVALAAVIATALLALRRD
jgi:PGF-CTERM protein